MSKRIIFLYQKRRCLCKDLTSSLPYSLDFKFYGWVLVELALGQKPNEDYDDKHLKGFLNERLQGNKLQEQFNSLIQGCVIRVKNFFLFYFPDFMFVWFSLKKNGFLFLKFVWNWIPYWMFNSTWNLLLNQLLFLFEKKFQSWKDGCWRKEMIW